MNAVRSFLVLFLLMFSMSGAAANKTILVIESYHAEYPWDASYMNGIKEELGDQYNIVRFQMDTKRLPKSEFEKRAEEAFAIYEKTKPDLVILGDDNALKYVGEKLKNQDTPVVYLGINSNPRSIGMVGVDNITGVLERPLFKRSIAEMNIIFKERLRKVLILFDSGTTSQAAVADEFQGRNSANISGVRADLKLIDNQADWEQSILSAKSAGYDAVIVGLYHTIVDDQNKHVPAGDILQWTSKNTPLPIFCFWDFAVGQDKTAGGLVLFGEVQGKEAARIAKKILSGTSPATISPIVAEKGRYLFSRAQLKKWGLTLPPSIAQKSDFTD